MIDDKSSFQREEEEAERARDDEYLPDPDAAPTVEGRVEQARAEMRKLMKASVVATAALGALFLAWDLVRGNDGMPNTIGFVLGAGAATLNMWSLGGGFYALMRDSAGRSLVAILASFIALIILSVFVVFFHREWVLGFAFGLAMPAAAGLVYGQTLKR